MKKAAVPSILVAVAVAARSASPDRVSIVADPVVSPPFRESLALRDLAT